MRIFLALMMVMGLSVSGSATEQLKYKVIISEGPFEIRYYAPYIEATVDVPVKDGRPQTNAFGMLAGYIFGGNVKRQKIAMTAPVISSASPEPGTEGKTSAPVISSASPEPGTEGKTSAPVISSASPEPGTEGKASAPVISSASPDQSEEIAMTAPVIRDLSRANSMRMSFSMPSEYSMDSLPIPKDQRVSLRTVEGHYKAALRFGGRARDKDYQEAYQRLLAALAKHPNFKQVSGMMTAGYDAPWTPGPFRRNEAMVTLEKVAE